MNEEEEDSEKEDAEKETSEEDSQHEDEEKEEEAGCDGLSMKWHSVIGASGLKGSDTQVQFQIRYAHGSEFSEEHCWMIKVTDFDRDLALPHPQIDRDGLKWDQRIVGKDIIMYWKQVGYAGWYLAKLIAYDATSEKHEIEWADGCAENWNENLLACKKVKEWRFVQDGEDIDEFLR